MKITFLGADHEVTGSCHYIEAAGKRFLVDCGMEQGIDIYENQPIPVDPSELDFVLLTHAHIDHSGNLPLLYSKGFKGPIYCTSATGDLCDIMLRDSAHIQSFEAEWRNRKGQRAGNEKFIPAYTMADAEGAIKLLHRCAYNNRIEFCNNISFRFNDVGHLLGSSAIEVWLREGEIEKKLVFSGDIGNINQPLIKDPSFIDETDYLIIESTYGDRSHDAPPDYIKSLAEVIQRTFDRGGNLVIPSFAVGRTQEMLYFIRQIKQEGLVSGHDGFNVYVDSPLAVEATTIFNEHTADCFDEEASELIKNGINPIAFPGLKLSITSDDSKGINANEKSKIILSASGMCDAGRIKHHLKHNLWREDSTILFVGYQGVGTLGRSLVDGAKDVKIFGEPIHVAAEICVLPGISGHADREGLIRWAEHFQKTEKVFVVHGEDLVCDSFAKLLSDKLGYDTMAPFSGTVYDLGINSCLVEAKGVPVKTVSKDTTVPSDSRPTYKKSAAFKRLEAAGVRLMEVISHNEGGANGDLTKFTNLILDLCDKWDR